MEHESVLVNETALLKRLLVSVSALGARIFRNQVGQYRLALKDCTRCMRHGRIIRSGLCVGSSDLVGWAPVTITPEMVGQRVAVFVAIECKSAAGRLGTEQRQFLQVVQQHGGIVCCARSEADAEMAIAPWLKETK